MMKDEPHRNVIVRGMAASPGIAYGSVCVISDPTALCDSLPNKFVLVSQTTDPRFVLYMMKAAAIVTEIGGRLCHTAIVALELGIPCIVAAKDACRILRPGQVVGVDGSKGVVFDISG